MNTQIWDVTKLNSYIKSLFDTNYFLNGITVEGEISNLTKHSSGHWYFSLKDNNSRISCVMFRSYASKVDFNPKNGDKVVLKGSVSVYEANGAYQIYATDMKPSGVGDLFLQLEKLKREFEEKGYFRPEIKKPIPVYPFKIGIISGENTAAYRDIIRTIYRRWPVVSIQPHFTLVQGNEASSMLEETIKKADRNNYDILIIARGGGSIEDLWCFNAPNVVEAIYQANTPIITGIGHEIDFTLADFVADLRASTPTAAAEKATPDIVEVKRLIANQKNNLQRIMTNIISNDFMRLDSYCLKLKSYQDKVDLKKEQLRHIKERLLENLNYSFKQNKNKLDNYQNNLVKSINKQLEINRKNINRFIDLLDAFNPTKILKRGYSIAYNERNEVIKSIEHIKIDDKIQLLMSDGKANAIINEVIKDGK